MTDVDVLTQLTDPQVLALTLYGEARGEPIEGRIAVGCVIRNRVDARRFGKDYRAVCLRKWQFSCWLPEGGLSNHEIVMSAARMLLRRERMLPMLRECLWIADGLISDVIGDRVKNATHYYAPDAMKPKGRVPTWAKGLEPVCVVGRHRFYVAA